MQCFTKAVGLPSNLARWRATVDAMLIGVDCEGPINMMVDQAIVPAGATHRRGGLHVDGRWCDATGLHRHSMDDDPPIPEGVVLAGSHLGCRAFTGQYNTPPKVDGDCSHISTSALDVVDLEPGYAWAGDSLRMLHESIPCPSSVSRTVVRLNVTGWGLEDLNRSFASRRSDRRSITWPVGRCPGQVLRQPKE
jgi:hypothetical protein